MKCNILVAVIPILLAAGAANAIEIYNKDDNKLDVYGKVDIRHQFSDDSRSNGDESYGRLGLNGDIRINDQLTGYGQAEYNFQLNNAENSENARRNKIRLGFAGLKFSDKSTIDYGRNYGLIYDAISWTDKLPVFGGDSSHADNFMNGRSTGLITYRNSNFFGLFDGWNLSIQYQSKNENSSRNRQHATNGDGVSVSTSYTSPNNVSVVGAYSYNDRTDAQSQGVVANGNIVGAGQHAETWATALKYDANNIYLAAMYGEMNNAAPISIITTPFNKVAGFANKSRMLEMVAQYQFDFGLRPSLAYVQSKGKNIEGVGDVDLYKYFDIGTTYFFNKNIATYIDYKINQAKKNNLLGLTNDNVLGIGLVYQF